MRVIVLPTVGGATLEDCPARNQLEWLQEKVGGDIEMVYTNTLVGTSPFTVCINGDAIRMRLARNVRASLLCPQYPQGLLGDVVILGIPRNGNDTAVPYPIIAKFETELGWFANSSSLQQHSYKSGENFYDCVLCGLPERQHQDRA